MPSKPKRSARERLVEPEFTDRDLTKAAECFGGLWPDTSLCGLLIQVQFNVARAIAAERRAAILGPQATGRRGKR